MRIYESNYVAKKQQRTDLCVTPLSNRQAKKNTARMGDRLPDGKRALGQLRLDDYLNDVEAHVTSLNAKYLDMNTSGIDAVIT